jgi:hypothetical protein
MFPTWLSEAGEEQVLQRYLSSRFPQRQTGACCQGQDYVLGLQARFSRQARSKNL